LSLIGRDGTKRSSKVRFHSDMERTVATCIYSRKEFTTFGRHIMNTSYGDIPVTLARSLLCNYTGFSTSKETLRRICCENSQSYIRWASCTPYTTVIYLPKLFRTFEYGTWSNVFYRT